MIGSFRLCVFLVHWKNALWRKTRWTWSYTALQEKVKEEVEVAGRLYRVQELRAWAFYLCMEEHLLAQLVDCACVYKWSEDRKKNRVGTFLGLISDNCGVGLGVCLRAWVGGRGESGFWGLLAQDYKYCSSGFQYWVFRICIEIAEKPLDLA